MKRNEKIMAALYQIAGQLVMGEDDLTKGQRERLGIVLLDVLSEPKRYSARTIRDLHRLAVEP